MFTTSRVLLVTGLVCFVPFFFPTTQHNQIPNGTEDLFTLGLPASPWFLTSQTETREESREGRSFSSNFSSSHSSKIELVAWSWLFPVGAMALIIMSWCFKSREAAKS